MTTKVHKIATAQLQDIQGDVEAALDVICKEMKLADGRGTDVICFPECFLQGYTLEKTLTKSRAIDLNSEKFRSILHPRINTPNATP